MNNNSLIVTDIEKKYGRHQCLKGASFSCEAGMCVGIAGLNGSGKSTLLSIMAGNLKEDDGSVFYDGINLLKDKKMISKYIGYVPQENPLIEDLTVYDNLMLWYCDSKYNLKDELENGFMKQLGIDKFKNKTVKKLSGGMKKRVSIAIAMHTTPKILLLDEPGAALDIEAKWVIREYIKKFKNAGGMVIIVTHDEEELDLCDKLYVMSNKTLVQTDRNLRGDSLYSKMTGMS